MTETQGPDIFGDVRMGYVVVGSRRLDQWKRFATEAIGLHLALDEPAALALRMDEHARRLIIEQDPAEDVLAIGWQLDSAATLDVVLGRLAARSVSVEQVAGEQAAARGVEGLYRFTGPKGLSIELFTTPLIDATPLAMRCSGYVTGAAGMGHVSLMSREPRRHIEFWRDIFDARVSDTIDLAMGSRAVLDVTFLRVNRRHHSIAVAATRGIAVDMYRTRIQHLNLEARTLDDLTAAYERCGELGYKLTRTVGQHPNDGELSFYVTSPSGFELEVGWNALNVDEASWQAGLSYTKMSNWGHDVPGRFASELEFAHLVNAAKSLRGREFLPW